MATATATAAATLPATVADFDELADTPAAREALDRLRAVAGGTHGPMERHCLRCRHIAVAVAQQQGWTLDDEVLTVAAILHDIGIYPAMSHGDVYTAEGADVARTLTAAHGWDPGRIQRCADAIDRHHDVRRQLARGAEVEALRRADLIDVSAGIVSFGLARTWLRELEAAVPRRGLGRELRRTLTRAMRDRPATLPKIFLRP